MHHSGDQTMMPSSPGVMNGPMMQGMMQGVNIVFNNEYIPLTHADLYPDFVKAT
jgi:hypothetical protein